MIQRLENQTKSNPSFSAADVSKSEKEEWGVGSGEWRVESEEWENEMGDIKWENNLVFLIT